MVKKLVTVNLVDERAEIEATYTDNFTTVTVKTSLVWQGGKQPLTVEQLQDAPAHIAMHLLKELTPPVGGEQSQ